VKHRVAGPQVPRLAFDGGTNASRDHVDKTFVIVGVLLGVEAGWCSHLDEDGSISPENLANRGCGLATPAPPVREVRLRGPLLHV
jgi:hypothetical protein